MSQLEVAATAVWPEQLARVIVGLTGKHYERCFEQAQRTHLEVSLHVLLKLVRYARRAGRSGASGLLSLAAVAKLDFRGS